MMKIESLTKLIEDKTVTADDFNMFIESIPTSVGEKVLRRSRLPVHNQDNEDPITTAKTITRPGDTDPTRTGVGKIAVRKRGERNKRNAHKFREALEFIKANNAKSIEECKVALSGISDLDALNSMLRKLITSDSQRISDWAYTVHRVIEDGR